MAAPDRLARTLIKPLANRGRPHMTRPSRPLIDFTHGLGARSIDPEDMPALFGIIVALCRRAGIAQVPSLYFLPSGVPTAFATGVGDQSVIVVSSGLLRLLMTRELTGVLAHEITHIAKHDVELMQLAGIVGQMTRVIAQVAIIIAIATWLLDIFGPGEGVDWLSLGVLVAAPIVANLILGALSRHREYQADLEAVALMGDPAGLARALFVAVAAMQPPPPSLWRPSQGRDWRGR